MSRKKGIYEKYCKRVLDVLCSGLALVILSPVLAVTAVLVRIKLGSPVIFSQKRPGLQEKIFTLYKFRSMTEQRDEHGELLPDEARLTTFGKLLRSTSLDELPELWNIFKGDMSIVGPRPLAVIYLDYYNEREKLRHSVRPGLTGLAQIKGRNAINWPERFEYDLEYIENISFKQDVRIIFKTIMKVIKHEDVAIRGTSGIKDFHVYRMEEWKLNGRKEGETDEYQGKVCDVKGGRMGRYGTVAGNDQ